MKKLFFIAIIAACTGVVTAQKLTSEQYIKQYKTMAVREMKRMGVPASITLAQGILETESGNSTLVKKSNNHFGIKCKSSWTAGGVSHDDDAPGECFRTYKDAEGSYRDHSNYLRGSDRYASLFQLDPKDYKGWAYGLKRAGYATNPRYPQMLIKYIEDYNLQAYTLEAVDEVPVYDASRFKDEPTEKAFRQLTKNSPAEPEMERELKVTINGSKAILAAKGRSLLAIATENNINLNKLLEYNDIEEDGLLDREQYIFLEKKEKQGNRDYVVAAKDETLFDIAQKNGVRLEYLYEYNDLQEGDRISPGSKIYLRHSEGRSDVVMNPSVDAPAGLPAKNKKVHSVQPKEGLYGISKKFGISVADLREWNNLQDDNLKIGQQLIVSK